MWSFLDAGENSLIGVKIRFQRNDYDSNHLRYFFFSPTTNLFDLGGRVAVVTGGNGGIGRSIAIGFAQAGAAVAILARNEEKNQRVMGELQPMGVRSLDPASKRRRPC